MKTLTDPNPDLIGHNVNEFLDYLGEPTTILLTGKDTSRCRAFVTLLHGNEPSGIMALFRWIKSGLTPVCNIVCVVASVKAAQQEPVFSHRVVFGQRDLNRCFKAPFDDEPGELAKSILDVLEKHQPEAVIDMHNTSGSGPAFGVATYHDKKHDALTALFTQRLIITNLKLGALMEISEHLTPTITIETGGRLDEDAHEIAWDGLQRYFLEKNIFDDDVQFGLEVLTNPVRLELDKRCTLLYANNNNVGYDLVFKPDIEHLNSGVIKENFHIGWINNKPLSELFSAKNSKGESVLDDLLVNDNGLLLTGKNLKLFMITCNPDIAKMDCLFYAVRSDGREIIKTL